MDRTEDARLLMLLGQAFKNSRRRPPLPPEERNGCARPPLHHERGRVLAYIRANDGISQRLLADKLSIRPQTLSELIAKLEEKELIIRTPNTEDRRELLLSLSEKGKTICEHMEAERNDFAKKYFSSLSEEEKNVLEKILLKIVETNSEDK